MESIGQKVDLWTNEWKELSIKSEIGMWDYFGLRPWILKYTPRYGEVLEAGCGLGRYNFYLSHFGIDICGLDFSEETIDHLNNWQKKNGYNLKFITGDVKNLPFKDNSLSGYLSFGVIEHFKEGPKEVLDEVYRVLRPGGIAIITTPNKSWNVKRNVLKRKIKHLIKKIIGIKVIPEPFFQYEYTPDQLKKFMHESNLFSLEISGSDYLYSFTEYGNFKGNNIHPKSFANKCSPILDRSFLKKLGAQSISITTKLSENMHCFFCGNKNAHKESLNKFNVPICEKCIEKEISNYYLKNTPTYFHDKYLINPKVLKPARNNCDFCKKDYISNELFEDFGFNKNVCPDCLTNVETNLELSNKNIKPIWRKRKQ